MTTQLHNANNRLTNMVDAAGTTRYAYTDFGALLSEDGPWDNDTLTYGYTTNRMRNRSWTVPTTGRQIWWTRRAPTATGTRTSERCSSNSYCQ
jgi:YD repeat-containing protein